MKKSWSLAAVGMASAGALALPAGAVAAPTIAPLAPCYTAVPPKGVSSIPISISGGGAGDGYVLSASYADHPDSGDAGSVSGNFDGSGNAGTALTDVYPPGDPIDPDPGGQVNISVEDFGASDVTTELGSTLLTVKSINVDFLHNDNPHKAHTVSVSGTQFAHQHLYGFITNKKGTRVLRRFSLGTGNVCGYASHKEIVAPPNFASGVYRLYVNPGKKLNKAAALSYPFQIFRF